MKAQQKLLTIKNTFPRIQHFDITERLNASLFNGIRYYANHDLGEEVDLILHEGREYLVSDHFAMRFPHDIHVDQQGNATSCSGFKVWIGGMGGTGKRDEIRRTLQCIMVAAMADYEGLNDD